MEYKVLDYNKELEITKFEIPNIIDLKKTFDCGQCFRWSYNGLYFTGIVDDKLIYITESEVDGGEAKQLIVNQPPEYLDTLIEYLGLNDEYDDFSGIELTEYEKKCVEAGKGIRILHQDKWETMVSFIISQRNNIPKIKTTIDRLSEKLGNKKEYIFKNNNVSYYTFPDASSILDNGLDGLSSCGLGYRDEYIYNLAFDWINNNKFIKNLDDLDSIDLIENLKVLNGVGNKVANCIALFGFNRLDTFPIDVWIQRIIDREYDGRLDISKFGNQPGLMQQYMFYNEKYN